MATPRQTLLLELRYDGSRFHGVHPQPGLPTVASAVRELVEGVARTECRGLTFTARTDAGVHAAQNFATLWFRAQTGDVRHELERARLDGLAIVNASWVDRSCNARNSSRGKRYRYRIASGRSHPQQLQDTWVIAPEADAKRMQLAAQCLVGSHDFAAFRGAGCSAKHTCRTLHDVQCSAPLPGTIEISVSGDNFLRKMVRIIAGTLAEVGVGLRTAEQVKQALASRARRNCGITAPAHGLTLESVDLDVEKYRIR